MKKISTLIVLMVVATFGFAQVKVTINLDMLNTDFDESVEDLYYSGDFNGWGTPGTDAEAKFIDNGDGTFTVVYENIESGYYWNDFYRENEGGSGWGTNGEWSGAPLGIDQMIYVGSEDVTVNAKWDETVDLKLSVDMSKVVEFDAATDTVYFINSYVGLNMTPLTESEVSGVYTVIFENLPQGLHLPVIFGYGPNDTAITTEWADTLPELATRVLVLDGDVDETCNFANTVGIENDMTLPRVLVYPNPLSGNVLNVEIEKFGKLNIIDITGKIVLSQQLKELVNKVDLTNVPIGLYIVQFNTENKTGSYKLVIE